jgi:hypothetical protein
MVQPKRMDETIGKHDSVSDLNEIEAGQYRYIGKAGPCMRGWLRFRD